MDLIVLIVAIAILALTALRGYRVGIARMVLYVITLILTIVLTGLLLRPVSLFIRENTSLYENIYDEVLDVVQEHGVVNKDALDQLPFPQYVLDRVGEEQIVSDNIEAGIAMSISSYIYNALIYICLNIVIYLLLRIIMGAFGIVTRLPVLKEVNKLAGFAVGFAEGILVLWLICLLLQACGSESWAQEIFVQINQNAFLNWIYSHNLVAVFLDKLI